MRKSQETFMKGFLLGNFSVRKCTQLTAHHQPLLLGILFKEISGLETFAGSGRCHVKVGWELAFHLIKSVLGQIPAVTTLFLPRERSRYLNILFEYIPLCKFLLFFSPLLKH